MKLLILIFIAIIPYSCCRHNETEFIKDKSWIPFDSISFTVYRSNSDILDTLYVSEVDSGMREIGFECVSLHEYKSCKLKSRKFQSFDIGVLLDCSSINFDINYLGNYYKFYYSSDNSNPFSNVYDAKFFDSLTFRGNNYAKVLLLKDNPQTFNVFYNKQGILRYVIDSDTFDLR